MLLYRFMSEFVLAARPLASCSCWSAVAAAEAELEAAVPVVVAAVPLAARELRGAALAACALLVADVVAEVPVSELSVELIEMS
jgi:hypothetical protein